VFENQAANSAVKHAVSQRDRGEHIGEQPEYLFAPYLLLCPAQHVLGKVDGYYAGAAFDKF